MPRYEVMQDEDGFYVVDLHEPALNGFVARFYGDSRNAFNNAKAFCFMKNMWSPSH
jgi:hypothetical protein